MNDNSFFQKSGMEEKYPDFAVMRLQKKINDLEHVLEDIFKKYNHNQNIMIMNSQNDDRENTKNFTVLEDENPLLEVVDKEGINVLDARPTLRLGSTGPYVTELQSTLTSLLYYTGSINGNFDNATENAVKRFQTNNRLTADGIVGRDTWSALSTLYSPLAICENGGGEDYFLYTVVKGDTLWMLARRFGTTVDAIKSLNGLTSDMLSIGQILRIPKESSEPDYTLYTVVRGDTLFMGNNEYIRKCSKVLFVVIIV